MAKRLASRLHDGGRRKWAVIEHAVDGGWGPTLRLIAIRAVPYLGGLVVAVAVANARGILFG